MPFLFLRYQSEKRVGLIVYFNAVLSAQFERRVPQSLESPQAGTALIRFGKNFRSAVRMPAFFSDSIRCGLGHRPKSALSAAENASVRHRER